MSIFDQCPECSFRVSRHTRRPVSVSSFLPIQPSSSSNPSAPSNSNNTLSTLLRLVPSLDKWTSQSNCRSFLQRIEHILSTSDIPSSEWYKIFPHVVSDPLASAWIQRNIIATTLDWPEAKMAFTSHFQLADHRVTAQRQFSDIKQK